MTLVLVKDDAMPIPAYSDVEWVSLMDIYNTKVRVLHMGANRTGKIKGWSLPYWDTRTQKAGERTYELQLEGDAHLTTFLESELYDA